MRESFTSDVNGTDGKLLYTSARPKDIVSLNVARHQELAEALSNFGVETCK